MRNIANKGIVCLLTGIFGSAHAATITATHAQSSALVAGGGDFSSGTLSAGTYTGTGFTVAEKFTGQSITLSSLFEVASGTPTGPLALAGPDTSNGVILWADELQGLTGSCDPDCIGEGAVSLLFGVAQASIGLDITKTNEGSVTFRFFEPSGTAFDPFFITPSSGVAWTFTGSAGHAIGGVTITNNDTYGVAYDNLRLAPAPVPVPAAVWLLTSGLAGLGLLRGRKIMPRRNASGMSATT